MYDVYEVSLYCEVFSRSVWECRDGELLEVFDTVEEAERYVDAHMDLVSYGDNDGCDLIPIYRERYVLGICGVELADDDDPETAYDYGDRVLLEVYEPPKVAEGEDAGNDVIMRLIDHVEQEFDDAVSYETSGALRSFETVYFFIWIPNPYYEDDGHEERKKYTIRVSNHRWGGEAYGHDRPDVCLWRSDYHSIDELIAALDNAIRAVL